MPMEKINDKTYVMSQLRRAMELGKFNEALSLIAGAEQAESEAATDWPRVRRDIDALLASAPTDNSGVADRYQVSFDEDTGEFDKLAVGT